MSTTSLVGGGLIAGESLYALGAGIASLFGACCAAAMQSCDHLDGPEQLNLGQCSCSPPPTPAGSRRARADLPALLSDHLHCERKAAENALSLVRRYPHRGTSVDKLGRLAHEETSHVVQVGALIARRGWTPRADTPNRYARALLAEVRGREPERLFDALLVAAFIEARSHERLRLAGARVRRAAATASWPTSTRRWRPPRSATPRSSSSWRGRCYPRPTATRASRELAAARDGDPRRAAAREPDSLNRHLARDPLPAARGA